MSKHELARIFHEIGTLLEIKGENPFKVRAYYKAAHTIDNLKDDLEELIQKDRLNEVPGFGTALSQKVLEWKNTGTISFYEQLKQTTPPGLLDLLRVPGLGPKKVAVISSALHITDLEMLETACRENKLINLPGFGLKTQEKIIAGLQFLKEHRSSFLWMVGMEWALKLQAALNAHPAVIQGEIAGSLRRCLPVINSIDLIAATDNPAAVMAFFTGPDLAKKLQIDIKEITRRGERESTLVLQNDLPVNLTVTEPQHFPAALRYSTGSHGHNQALNRHARDLGYELRPDGLRKGETQIDCRDETELYQHLGLSYIPPELRENLGELEAAVDNKVPKLVQPEELQGLFHVHTNYSDGHCSLREMVTAAISRGYHYLGIADHSQSAFYAHGLSKEALSKQWAEIDQLNQEYPDFKIFKGIEADILPSGDLDYDPETLAQFDFVIGSIHTQFRLGEVEMTERILKAMDNPYFTMLGHPTGRLLLSRPAYAVNLEPIIKKAAATGTIIEFNANPYRLDLDWSWCRQAKALGVSIAINPDAHAVEELDLARLSLPMARKGWLEKNDVFNTKTSAEIQKLLIQ